MGVSVGCSYLHRRASSTQDSGHARGRLSSVGPLGLARHPDSVVVEMLSPRVTPVLGGAERPGSAEDHQKRPVSGVHDGRGGADAGLH